MAGDRGMRYPELTAGALQHLETSGCSDGYSTSRTCEMSLSNHSGINFRGLVYLIDEVRSGSSLPMSEKHHSGCVPCSLRIAWEICQYPASESCWACWSTPPATRFECLCCCWRRPPSRRRQPTPVARCQTCRRSPSTTERHAAGHIPWSTVEAVGIGFASICGLHSRVPGEDYQSA